MNTLPVPAEMTLEDRQALAVQLRTQRANLLRVMEETQRFPELLARLAPAAEELARIIQFYWPEQAWEGVNHGAPKHRDLHVKVVSVVVDRDEWQPGGVALRLGLSVISANSELTERSAIYVPLEVADLVIGALAEHANYWRSNPPNGGR